MARLSLIGMAFVVLAAVAGFGVGVALERSGSVDPVAEPDPATVRDSRVVSFDCPNGNPVVALGRADRILVIGRDEDGTWVELRSPLDAAAVVWLPAAQVDLSGEVGSLPVHTCGAPRPTPPTIPPNPADDRPLATSTTRPVVAETTTSTQAESTTTTTTEAEETTTTTEAEETTTTTEAEETTTTTEAEETTTTSSTTAPPDEGDGE